MQDDIRDTFMRRLCLYLLTIFAFIVWSAPAYSCELRVFTTNYLNEESPTVQALRYVNTSDRCDIALVYGGASTNKDLLENVRIGIFDSVILPLKYALENIAASNFDEIVAKNLAKILVSFGSNDATETSTISNDIVPIVVSESNVVILSVMPVEARYALWSKADWDGRLESENAKFKVAPLKNILTDSTVWQSYSTPVTFYPHAILMNEREYYELSEEGRDDLISSLNEISIKAAAEVQLEQKNKIDEMLSDGSLDAVDFPVTHEDLMESIDAMLGEKIDFNDPLLPFQCAIDMCPCTGSNTCSKKCCER